MMDLGSSRPVVELRFLRSASSSVMRPRWQPEYERNSKARTSIPIDRTISIRGAELLPVPSGRKKMQVESLRTRVKRSVVGMAGGGWMGSISITLPESSNICQELCTKTVLPWNGSVPVARASSLVLARVAACAAIAWSSASRRYAAISDEKNAVLATPSSSTPLA